MIDVDSIRRLMNSKEAATVLKYIAVGTLSVALNFLAFLLCLRLRIDYFAAAVIGYFVGLLNSFALSYLFVFRPKPSRRRTLPLMFLIFILIYGAGGLMMGFGVDYGVESLGFPATPTWLTVAAFVIVWNYLGSRFVVFKGAA